jgi:iron complex outermembrane receptor protein
MTITKQGCAAIAVVAFILGLGSAQAADPTAQPAGTTPAAAVSAAPTPAPAAASPDAGAFDFFLKEAEVVTASRRAQKISDSPVAIDVITREEIAASGARDIWDLLRFKVGMDVEQASSIDGNVAEVNVRGLPGEFSQSLQVLIDGRSVLSASNSGVYWEDLPVSLDDIERIEIVRGPNSPLFGANAGQGVINIITIKPGDGDGAEFRGEVGQYGWHLG